MHLDIYSDTVCPWCLIGKRRLEKALAQRPEPGLTIRWRPFQLNPGMPAEGMDRQEYIELKFGSGGNRTYDRVREVGQGEGIPFAFDKILRQPNTVDSHRLIEHAWKARRQDAVVEAMFRAYFVEGRYIGDRDVLADVAGQAGLDPTAVRAYLDGAEDVEKVTREDAAARQLGITGVPFFVVNDTVAMSGAQPPEMFFKLFDQARAQTAAE